ncbi:MULTISPECIES: IS630 family transposase [unclassified Sphingomonas]|uniref:IS630 family transposase n=1 Tax=unclassified Sphingomonas TaxID=196159 RepID=UPI00226AE04E|nr:MULTISPECIES: IS630 family transposase [unclassified Sphingomonas]
MYTDPNRWTAIRKRIVDGGESIRSIARTEGLSRPTIRKIIREARPKPYARVPSRKAIDDYAPFIEAILIEDNPRPQAERRCVAAIFRHLRDERGYNGSYSSVRRCCRSMLLPRVILEVRPTVGAGMIQSLAISHLSKTYMLTCDSTGSSQLKLQLHRDGRTERRAEVHKWVDDLRADRLPKPPTGDRETVGRLLSIVRGSDARRRNKAIAALAHGQGFPIRQIAQALDIGRNTCRRYVRAYLEGGVEQLTERSRTPLKATNEELKAAVFRVLHEPPINHGFNRASWIMRDLRAALAKQDHPVGLHVLRQIIHEAGWKWRKARIVLTSQDPAYRDKLAAVQAILSNLALDEAFFSIDEFGPFAVKMKQGLMLDPPGRHRVVPQWQKSKGCMIMTAALELSTNQITHFYSERKNTTEMIRMMDVLVDQYANRRTIYLSWDAASWHVSKKLMARIEEHNATAEAYHRPRVATAPLPAGAQFLNVIESVFSGMARAVIHNSDYASADAARAAIDQYFADRNQQFRENPRRAGKRIWGDERVVAEFSDSNNCKDPRWR